MNSHKILSWNVRGLRKAKNKRNLKDLIRKHDPGIICVHESMLTELHEKDMKLLWNQGEFKVIFQPAKGHSGGLVTCWNPELYELFNYISVLNCLGVTLKALFTGQCFNVYKIYGPQQSSKKRVLWKVLKDLLDININNPCIFIGDFNCVRTVRERFNCSGLREDQSGFNKWIKDSNLIEIPLVNAKYTWLGPGGKKSRLDRAFANIKWAKKGNWELKATIKRNSDHRGILLSDSGLNWGPRPFRIFNVWLKEHSLFPLIEKRINEGNWKGNVQAILKNIKEITREWNLGINENIHVRIENLESKIAELEDKELYDQDLDISKMELEELHLKKDSMLKQKARISWLKEEDRNTKFFHQAIQKRRSRNNIRKLSFEGKSITEPVEIKQVIL